WPIDLKSLISRAIVMLETSERYRNLKVQTTFPDVLKPVTASPIELEQAIINLAQNASQSTDGRVNLVISVSQTGSRTRIRVSDDGPGIHEDVLPHIFDLFYTTREASGGKGLGLATVRRIVEGHSGSITVDSIAGRGTKFTINLPTAPPETD